MAAHLCTACGAPKPRDGYRRIAQIGPVVVMWGRMTSDEIKEWDEGKDLTDERI